MEDVDDAGEEVGEVGAVEGLRGGEAVEGGQDRTGRWTKGKVREERGSGEERGEAVVGGEGGGG